MEGIAYFDTARVGGVGGAIDTIDRLEGRAIGPANRIVAQFGGFVFRPGSRSGDAEGLVGIVPCEQPRNSRRHVIVQIVVPRLRRADELYACAVAQRIAGVEIDHRTKRTLVERGRCRLVDDDRIEQFGSKDVEVERAIAIERCAIDRGRDRFHAIDANTRELRPETAHGDLATFARVTFDRHAGNSLQRFRKIGVGEFGDVFRDDDIDLADCVALGRYRGIQRLAKAGNDDDIVFGGNFAGRFTGNFADFVVIERTRILRKRRGRKNQRAAGQQSRLRASRGNHKPHCILLQIGTGVFLKKMSRMLAPRPFRTPQFPSTRPFW